MTNETRITRTRSSTLTTRDPARTAEYVMRSFFDGLTPRTREAYRIGLLHFAAWLEVAGQVDGAPVDFQCDDDDERTLAMLASFLFAASALDVHALVIAYIKFYVEKGHAPNTINQRVSALRSFMRMGRMLGAVGFSLDVRGVKTGKVRDTRGPVLEDVKRVLNAARGPREEAILSLLFHRGLRGVEVRELEVQHLRLGSTPPVILVRGKGKTGLTPLTIAEHTAAKLRAWLQKRGDHPGFVFNRMGHADQMLSRPALWAVVSAVGKRAGVKLWPHALRHSAITVALDATNGDIRKVQQFSRHQKVQTLMEYDDQRRDDGGTVTELLSGEVK